MYDFKHQKVRLNCRKQRGMRERNFKLDVLILRWGVEKPY